MFLDEVIDADAVGELENYVLSAAGTPDETIISEFLAEIMDKVEVKYNQLLEKTHAFNAVLKS